LNFTVDGGSREIDYIHIHKMKEVMSISDRITVLRRGKLVGTVEVKNTSEKELAR
jgi:ABC-type uncharacterized transport system ATPase subunit